MRAVQWFTYFVMCELISKSHNLSILKGNDRLRNRVTGPIDCRLTVKSLPHYCMYQP
jgi:hypothetical protein